MRMESVGLERVQDSRGTDIAPEVPILLGQLTVGAIALAVAVLLVFGLTG